MNNTTNIRRATGEDVEQMADLLALLFSIEVDFTIDRKRQLDGLRLLLASPTSLVLVAETDSGLVGMCTAQQTISTAEGGPAFLVEDLVIEESWRRRGIGQELLEEIAVNARNRGISRLQLLCDTTNSEALAFYGRQGWQKTRLICLRSNSGGE